MPFLNHKLYKNVYVKKNPFSSSGDRDVTNLPVGVVNCLARIVIVCEHSALPAKE